MAIKDVCRLCLTEDELVWIFDKRFESSDNMKDVIYITTGVEVRPFCYSVYRAFSIWHGNDVVHEVINSLTNNRSVIYIC